MRKQAAIKFCGLTRPEDAVAAASLGAAYLGVIFAPSSRRCTVEQARQLFDAVAKQFEADERNQAAGRDDRQVPLDRVIAAKSPPKRVGVFAEHHASEISSIARELQLDVIQLHEAWETGDVEALRNSTGCRVWTVVRVGLNGDMPDVDDLSAVSDGLLLDTKVAGALGGTGETFDWSAVRDGNTILGWSGPVILAGGLHPQNVALAIATLRPDVVDVSSGVESSPGVKDHARMRAFADAVRGVFQE